MMKTVSGLMRFFNMIGQEKIAWSLRRLHCPVDRAALVLEVGSGGNPYPRANVLLDGYENSIERVEHDLVSDRPLVIGFVERLPFKDNSFDFVIASHVLEHTSDPEMFLSELQRVARAGYIETPDAFFERINPFTYHRLEVTDHGGVLNIFLKPSWRHASEIVDMYEAKVKDKHFIRYLSKHPAPFYTRFFWKDEINYKIMNPGTDARWPLPAEAYQNRPPHNFRWFIRNKLFLSTIRLLFSQNRRNHNVDLSHLMQCPSCHGGLFTRHNDWLVCGGCNARYEVRQGVYVMQPRESEGV